MPALPTRMTFTCARCHNQRRLLGRRKVRVKGIPQYVCAGCVAPQGRAA